MARGFTEKFAGRMTDAEADMRAALVRGDSRGALHLGNYAYGSEAKKLRERRADDGALADAERAALQLAAAEGLGTYKPLRKGRHPGKVSPQEMLATFDRVLRRARGMAAP